MAPAHKGHVVVLQGRDCSGDGFQGGGGAAGGSRGGAGVVSIIVGANLQRQIGLFIAILTPLTRFHETGANTSFVFKKQG